MQINRLWTVMLTRESGNSDTDSSIHEFRKYKRC